MQVDSRVRSLRGSSVSLLVLVSLVGCTFGAFHRNDTATQDALELASEHDREALEHLEDLLASKDHAASTERLVDCIGDHLLAVAIKDDVDENLDDAPQDALERDAWRQRQHARLRESTDAAEHCIKVCENVQELTKTGVQSRARDVGLALEYRSKCDAHIAAVQRVHDKLSNDRNGQRLRMLAEQAEAQASQGCFAALSATYDALHDELSRAQGTGAKEYAARFEALREAHPDGFSRMAAYRADAEVSRNHALRRRLDADLQQVDAEISDVQRRLTDASGSSAYNVHNGQVSHSSGNPALAEDLRERLDGLHRQRRAIEAQRQTEETASRELQRAYDVDCG